MRPELPSGTVTVLFTDVEGSTRLLYELGAEAYAAELAEHRTLVREACAAQGGVEVDTQGDASFFAFPTAPGALAAAAALTEALAATDIRVRVGIHTGTPHLTSEGYVGDDVHLAARVASSGHGGQILVSEETSGLARDGELVSLGTHRLKDIPEPVRLYQLGEGSFPPLKTEANTNLPTPASSFLGREAELAQADLLLQETRLLTVTGPGGAGKTRFALELATRAREERFSDYRDGVFSCFFSSLRDPSLLLATIAQTLSVREQPGTSALETLASHLQAKRLLLLLDNLEHLLEAAPELSELLQSCPTLTLLCTSRERLRLQGEFAYELPPLVEEEGVSLFCERARTEPTDATRALCDHLEGLPLALELAAARMGLLSAEQLLERLSGRLDLLKGTRDADPRQQTLRATIQWSYDLLSPEEQTLFARLSVFSGGCTLEAAEEVCDADLDSLHSLVDKSLLRRVDTETGPRFWMLETIREFAGERLEDMGDAEEAMRRHADFVLRLATQFEAGRGSEREIRTFSAEQDNFRTAIAWAEERDRSDTQLDLISRCWRYWWYRGHPMEGLRWVESALACSEGERSARRAKVLAAGAMFAYRFGDLSSM
ncbi:MAG TPA: adenylate/guanylate cyclase domain-containing protein, partial [Longimicrobiales bacterium]|nr:adenylate/guanylate cyclase domain-containing protein [Longimicrobiales bacterium]